MWAAIVGLVLAFLAGTLLGVIGMAFYFFKDKDMWDC